MPEVVLDGPLDLDDLRGAFYCYACGALVHKWGQDEHIRFHERVDAQQA
jgi:hypothetical protein